MLQANITRLPLRARFDLIVARHPDVDRHRADWERALSASADWLNENGILLITLYSLLEADTVRAYLSRAPLAPFPLGHSHLPAPGLVGQDRFVLVYQLKSP